MSPRRRRTLLVLLAVLALALLFAPAAFAGAGGGSAGFSGGGGEGGGGGGSGKGFAIYLLIRLLIDIALIGHGKGLIVLVAIGLIYLFVSRLLPRIRAWWQASRQRGGASRRATAKRTRKVELAAAEAADDDPVFAPDAVRHAAENLYTSVQAAWSREDVIALRSLIAPGLLAEWERRLDDMRSRGWTNHVEVLDPPEVHYVGLRNRGSADEDEVTVRIDARLRDYVVDRNGRHVKRTGAFTETVRVREFWTLRRREDHWILAAIEQGAEGRHAMQDEVVATPWSDEKRMRDEALVEGAVADAVPDGTPIAELADLSFDGDGRAAANDLSLADGRFAPDVLEVAARRAVEAWARAVDGDERALRTIADRDAIDELLYPGDASRRIRLVVRGPSVSRIRIHHLDAAATPPTMTLDVEVSGRRYLQERDTTAIVSGSQTKVTTLTERWTMALSGDEAQPWRLTGVDTPVGRA